MAILPQIDGRKVRLLQDKPRLLSKKLHETGIQVDEFEPTQMSERKDCNPQQSADTIQAVHAQSLRTRDAMVS